MKISIPIRLRAALLSCLFALPVLTVDHSFGKAFVLIPDEASDFLDAANVFAPTLGNESAYSFDDFSLPNALRVSLISLDTETYGIIYSNHTITTKPLGDEGAANTDSFYWFLHPDDGLVLNPTTDADADVIASYQDKNRVATSVTLADIDRSFVGIVSNTAINGAAINHNEAGLSISIDGDLVANMVLVDSSGTDVLLRGGALYSQSDISTINSHFVGNVLDADYASSSPAYIVHTYGAAIFNSSSASIGELTGDFIANKSLASSDGFIGKNDENDRVATSLAGAIYNEGIMGNITGDYIKNLAQATATTLHYSDGANAYGGAIYNSNTMGNITGDFLLNNVIAKTVGGFALAYGGAIHNDKDLGHIKGTYLLNSVYAESSVQAFAAGGAINSHAGSTIDSIQASFIGNRTDSITTGGGHAYALGGAVYSLADIELVTGYYLSGLSRAKSEQGYASASSAAYYNLGKVTRFEATLAFNNLAAISTQSIAQAQGAGIANTLEPNGKDLVTGQINILRGHIETLKSDFHKQSAYAESHNSSAYSTGAAIYNLSSIVTIQGTFSENRAEAYAHVEYAQAEGAALHNVGEISEIHGHFASNSANGGTITGRAVSSGGAISNSNMVYPIDPDNNRNLYLNGDIKLIDATFVNNMAKSSALGNAVSATSYGGAISNAATITAIKGYFLANTANSTTNEPSVVPASLSSYGGALYNTGTITTMSSHFIGNAALGYLDAAQVKGGGIYNNGSIGLLALQNDIEFTGNYTQAGGQKTSNAIHNAGLYIDATIAFNAYGEQQITVNDAISGEDLEKDIDDAIIQGKPLQILEINSGLDGKGNPIDAQGASFSTVSFNNSVEQQTINVHGGTLILGEYAGGSYEHEEQVHSVEASQAALIDSDLNIKEAAHVITNASYLAKGYVSNEGDLTLTGGTLDTQDGKLSGTGRINLTAVVQNNVAIETTYLTMSWNGADYGALHSSATGTLTLGSGSTVDLSITPTRPAEDFRWTILQYSDLDLITSYDDLAGMILINGEYLASTDYFLKQGADGLSYTLVSKKSIFPSYEKFSLSTNGLAGGILLDQVDQQAGIEGQDLAAVMDEIYTSYISGGESINTGDQLAAAVAGAGIASLGSAMMSSMEMQLQRMLQHSGSLLPEGQDNYWIAAEGTLNRLDSESTFAGHQLSSWGGSVGAEYGLSENMTLSIGLTALYGDLDANSVDRAEGDLDSYYLSAAAYHKSGSWVHQGFVSAGLIDASLNRHISHASGNYSTSGSTDGYSLGIMYELGYEIALRENTKLTPVINAALMHGSLDSYTETGSDAALSVGEIENTYATFGLGARLSVQSSTGIQTSARALFKLDAGNRQQSVGVGFRDIAGTHSTIYGQEASAFGVELGLGVSIPVSTQSSVFMNGTTEIRRDQQTINGSVGYKLSF